MPAQPTKACPFRLASCPIVPVASEAPRPPKFATVHRRWAAKAFDCASRSVYAAVDNIACRTGMKLASAEQTRSFSLSNSTRGRDLDYVLHPNTNARLHEAIGPMVIDRGEGIYVYDETGQRYIDTLSGAWSVGLGFGEQRLVEAASTQMRRLPYYHSFYHKTHDPGVALAEKLVTLASSRLRRVFFANSGSEANDTVVKIIWYYNNSLGRKGKKKIISRWQAYHGVTVASGSLTGLRLTHADFDLPMAGVLHTACPHFYRFGMKDESENDFASRMADELEKLIQAEGPETIAAFIGEPVMGAGGVIVPPRGYWRKIQDVCRKYDVLLVADEVITGFGRTGRLFASELYDIDPDIMVLSKQLTSSYMPLSAILLTDEIYQVVADNSARLGSFGHGFTTGGHPVAAAVALESIRIIEERDLVGHAQRMGTVMLTRLRELEKHPLVGEVRGVGLIAGVELVADKATRRSFEPTGKLGSHVFQHAHTHGLITRAIQDTIAFCPPLIIDESEIDDMLRRFARTLDDAYVWARANLS